MNITLTEFWTESFDLSSSNGFHILSDKFTNLSASILGKGKVYIRGERNLYQLKCIVLDGIFFVDFSCPDTVKNTILQQMWILKHVTGVDYYIHYTCLWEKFKLPTAKQLNEFAKVVEQPVTPEVLSSETDYATSIRELSSSTRLGENSLLRNIRLPLSEYVDLMLRMQHSVLDTTGVIHHATVIHNHHNPVVRREEDLYNDSLQILMDATDMEESAILPEDGEALNTYIGSINRLLEDDQDINFDDVTRHATNVYNYHRITHPLLEDVTIDHPF